MKKLQGGVGALGPKSTLMGNSWKLKLPRIQDKAPKTLASNITSQKPPKPVNFRN